MAFLIRMDDMIDDPSAVNASLAIFPQIPSLKHVHKVYMNQETVTACAGIGMGHTLFGLNGVGLV